MSNKPKVIISTDIGGNDKDDAQSLIHALLYADDVDYLGFIGTTSDAKNIDSITPMNQIVDAYEKDLPKLRQDGDYPSADALRDLITQGANTGDWPGKLSDGAKLIIDAAREASPDAPVYLLEWGPIHDIARALYEAPDIVENVRIISIGPYRQDWRNPDAYNWLEKAVANDSRYDDLWWIQSHETHIGMHATSSGIKNPDANLGWVKENVAGHGALGDLFYKEFTTDLYGNGTTNGLKMGDTPSLLYLLDDVNDDNPLASSWGGSFKKSSLGDNVWIDRTDGAARLGDFDGARTVFQHRDEVWGEFAELLDVAKNGSSGGGSGTDDSGSGGSGSSTGGGSDDDGAGSGSGDHDDGSHDGSADETGALPTFKTRGTNANETLKGGSGADSIDGGRGDDTILGRSKADILTGGAGNDNVNGGADNDTLVYVVGRNFGVSDLYSGASGVDTLKIYATSEEMADGKLAADVAALEAFMSRNYDAGTNGGAVFDFSSIGLSVRGIEKVVVVNIDDAQSPGDEPSNEGGSGSDTPSDPDDDVTPPDTSGDLPEFKVNDGAGDGVLKGGGSSDSINGRAGDDYILGRGSSDTLAGGSGSDEVKGGAGNDILAYLIGTNEGEDDSYTGSAGIDRLQIYGTEAQLTDADFLEDIAALESFMEDNYDTARNGGKTFDFDSLGLSVRSVEVVDLIVVEDQVA